MAVVLWNRGNTTAPILGRFVDMQLYGKASARDCTEHKDLGVFNGQITLNVSGHDVRVVVLTPVPALTSATNATHATPTHDTHATPIVRSFMSDSEWAARWKGHGIKIPQSRLVWEAANKGGRRAVNSGSKRA